jgi:hypothetical protein
MKHSSLLLGSCSIFVFLGVVLSATAQDQLRRLSVQEYREKMKAGWIGQIIGVSWGAPTEGKYDRVMPGEAMPPFRESLINDAFDQDDLYVEMTFLRSLEQYGFGVTWRQAGIDFANSRYRLWVANDAGRRNLRNGIAPPDSSHPKFHNCAGAIDYQIEADYAGLICPGMPNAVIALGEKFGRLMNYGDGVYAGQFMGALYAEAYFEKDPLKLIQAGLKAIPTECLYAEMVRDMVRWRAENPEWEKAWELLIAKYHRDKNYNISALDVKREGGCVLMGLLYGEGDLDKTMIISCRCGFDSDCNPSSSGGILFTARGMPQLPERYYRLLDEKKKFSYTEYNFPGLIEVCEKLTRQVLVREGGRVEKNPDGTEVFLIPNRPAKPSRLEDLKHPGPVAESVFTDDEMRQIQSPDWKWALPKKLPGWSGVGIQDGSFWWTLNERSDAFELRSTTAAAPWKLTRTLEVSANRKTRLTLALGKTRNEWECRLSVGQDVMLRKMVGPEMPRNSWLEVEADLSSYAGKTITLELTGEALDKKAKEAPWCRVAAIKVENSTFCSP